VHMDTCSQPRHMADAVPGEATQLLLLHHGHSLLLLLLHHGQAHSYRQQLVNTELWLPLHLDLE
jgi:hypothetical protein